MIKPFLNSHIHIRLSLLLPLVVLLISCDDASKQTQKSSWEDLKENAKDTYNDAVTLSQEKWQEISNLSKEEWTEADKKIQRLKEKAANAQPKLEQMIADLEALQIKASENLKKFEDLSGDKKEEYIEAFEKNWEKLQQKIEEIEQELKAV